MTPDIVAFGSINLDFVFAMDALPGPGQTRLARSLSVQPGGKGANQAAAACLAGASVCMVGAVGDDELADPALAVLARAGVDLSAVRRVPGARTGCASIGTDPQGRNQISVALGANAELRSADLPDALLAPGAILLAQMESDPAQVAAILERGYAAGMFVVLNLAPMRMLPREALRRVAILVVNEDEAEALAVELSCAPSAASLHGELGATVVRTLGRDGAEAAGPGGALRAQPPSVQAVDTTAAGDCFVGTLAAELRRRRPLAAALERACAAAAFACTRHGSQSSLPSAAEVDAFLRPA